MEAAMESKRKRKHHRRSRNGCYTCKQRHTRCDEERPFCRNCLRLGGSCGYPNDSLSQDISSQDNLDNHHMSLSPALESTMILRNMSMSSPSPVEILGCATYDPFQVLPGSVARSTQNFMDHCQFALSALLELKFECRHKVIEYQATNYKILLRGPQIGTKVWSFAMSDPIVFHATLLLTAEHMKVVGVDDADVDSALLHHKVEVIRLVNERLGDPMLAMTDGTVGGIACLAILESLHGAYQIAEMHLKGLEQLMKMRGGIQRTAQGEVLKHLIALSEVLTASALNSVSRFVVNPLPMIDTSATSSQQEELDLYHDVADVSYYEMTNGLDTDTSKMFLELRTLSFHIGAQPRQITLPNAGDRIASARSFISSRRHAAELSLRSVAIGEDLNGYDKEFRDAATKALTCYIAGSIYLHSLLLKASSESNIVVEALRDLRRVLEDSESGDGTKLPEPLLFWVLFAACAALTKKEERSFVRDEDDMGVDVVSRRWFFEKLANCASDLDVMSRDAAREMLWRFAWVPYIGDIPVEEVWVLIEGFLGMLEVQRGGRRIEVPAEATPSDWGFLVRERDNGSGLGIGIRGGGGYEGMEMYSRLAEGYRSGSEDLGLGDALELEMDIEMQMGMQMDLESVMNVRMNVDVI